VHSDQHLYWTLAFLALTTALLAVVRTRTLKRRLSFAGLGFIGAIGLHLVIISGLDPTVEQAILAQGPAVELMLVAFGLIAVGVALTFNPWWREKSTGVPAIVQDSMVAATAMVAALFLFQSTSFFVGLTGSAIVLGLALQDTLGNAFAGLALQIERPFRVGHWVLVGGEHEGRVTEVTWRATKITTKAGNLVVLPNSEVAKAPITNYTHPTEPTRLFVDVGTSYSTPPNETRDAILAAVRRVPGVLEAPSPDTLLWDFGPSALLFRCRFWIREFDRSDVTAGAVRSAIYYELRRREIEIPFPMQVEISRDEVRVDNDARREQAFQRIAAVPVLGALPEAAQRALAEGSRSRLFADGEAIVREGEPGGSMYIVEHGQVAVTVGPEAQRVAVTKAGGYFGEMSLLTGAARSATVTALGDSSLLEIAAGDFRTYVQTHPSVVQDLATAAVARQRELDAARSTASSSVADDRESFITLISKFFGLE
jgi:CRP-like cAMP-binding protein